MVEIELNDVATVIFASVLDEDLEGDFGIGGNGTARRKGNIGDIPREGRVGEAVSEGVLNHSVIAASGPAALAIELAHRIGGLIVTISDVDAFDIVDIRQTRTDAETGIGGLVLAIDRIVGEETYAFVAAIFISDIFLEVIGNDVGGMAGGTRLTIEDFRDGVGALAAGRRDKECGAESRDGIEEIHLEEVGGVDDDNGAFKVLPSKTKKRLFFGCNLQAVASFVLLVARLVLDFGHVLGFATLAADDDDGECIILRDSIL